MGSRRVKRVGSQQWAVGKGRKKVLSWQSSVEELRELAVGSWQEKNELYDG